MSRGLGSTERAILAEQFLRPHTFLTTHQLAKHLGVSQQQIYRAARSLADKELVELTLEPELRIWRVGATERRRAYARSIGADWSEKEVRRPGHCGPDCQRNHVGADKQHFA